MKTNTEVIKEFREKFVIDIGIGADDRPYQNCHMDKNGKCGFVTTQDIEDFWLSKLQAQKEEIIERCIKYIRSGEMAGSFSEGCDCEKCNSYEKKIRKKLTNLTPQ